MFNKKPFFIAEISANHAGSITRAFKLIKIAKKYGADAVKLQTYTADTMTINCNNKYFKIKDGLWKNKNLWKLYDEAKTPLEWHSKLFNFAKKIKIPIFSTPFDETAVDFLEKLKTPYYKISSFEMNDVLLIKKVASTGKPIIISTGMANLKEIEKAFNTAKKYSAKKISLLYCVSNYPSKINDFNMNNIRIMKKKFKCTIGFSDHSLDNRIAIAAVAAGAEIVEKHIALENQKVGHDIKFSLKGKQIKKFREDIDAAYQLFRIEKFTREEKEKKLRIHRRSIFVVKDILKGEKFTKENIKVIRPGHGLEPTHFKNVLGKRSKINIKRGNPLKEKIIY